MKENQDMTTLPPVITVLESVKKRSRALEKIMLGIIAILALSGLSLFGVAFFMEGADRLVILVGGALFFALAFLPYAQVQYLRKQNLVIGMILTLADEIHAEVTTERLNQLASQLLQFSLRGRP